jgi:multiple sugar transport system ATP-binding protein
MAIVQTRKLTKLFRKGQPGAVVDVDLESREGEFLVLLGPSGSGKTTLLRMIAGLEEPTSGEILIGGAVVNDLTPRQRRIAMVFQSYALYPHLTAQGNIEFPLKAGGMPKEERRKKAEWAAALLGIPHLLHRKPRELSGGERQRVALARAIVREPSLFLFDEPLSNLDAKLRVYMRTELKRLHRDIRSTMIYVTHDQVEAMTMADRIVIMNHGRIQQLGTPLEVYDTPANRFVAGFIGSPPMNFFEGEIAADPAGAAVRLGGGVLVPLARPELAASAGRKVFLGIRPEHISLAASGRPLSDVAWAAIGMPAKVPASIEFVEPLGHRAIVTAGSPIGAFLMETETHAAIRTGEPVDLWFDMNRAYLFDRDSDAVI